VLLGWVMAPSAFIGGASMDRGVGAAARLLPESDRKDLAIQALAGSGTVSDLAARHGVSRKFIYQQTHKARAGRGSDPGYTRNVESLGWHGSGQMGWTAPNGIDVPKCGSLRTGRKGAARNEHYHDRP